MNQNGIGGFLRFDPLPTRLLLLLFFSFLDFLHVMILNNSEKIIKLIWKWKWKWKVLLSNRLITEKAHLLFHVMHVMMIRL